MLFRPLAAAVMAAIAAPALAQTSSPIGMAMELGQVVGSAEACGVSVSDDAVVAYLEKNDMLSIEVTATFENYRSMYGRKDPSSTSCAVVRASVRANGLSAE